MGAIEIESLDHGRFYIVDGKVEPGEIKQFINPQKPEHIFLLEKWNIDYELYLEIKDIAQIMFESFDVCVVGVGEIVIKDKERFITNSAKLVSKHGYKM